MGVKVDFRFALRAHAWTSIGPTCEQLTACNSCTELPPCMRVSLSARHCAMSDQFCPSRRQEVEAEWYATCPSTSTCRRLPSFPLSFVCKSRKYPRNNAVVFNSILRRHFCTVFSYALYSQQCRMPGRGCFTSLFMLMVISTIIIMEYYQGRVVIDDASLVIFHNKGVIVFVHFILMHFFMDGPGCICVWFHCEGRLRNEKEFYFYFCNGAIGCILRGKWGCSDGDMSPSPVKYHSGWDKVNDDTMTWRHTPLHDRAIQSTRSPCVFIVLAYCFMWIVKFNK